MLVDKIREELDKLLAGDTSLSQFEDWLIPTTWSLADDDPAMALSSEITLILMEFTDKQWTLPEVLTQLLEIKDRLPAPTQA